MKRGNLQSQPRRKKQKLQSKKVETGSTEDVLLIDVNELLKKHSAIHEPSDLSNQDGEQVSTPTASLPERFSEVELDIDVISSSGDGLAYEAGSNHVYVVPFTAPGDRVMAKVIRHMTDEHYTITDFVKVLKPSPLRNDTLIKCPYFQTCSGCQFQMLDYSTQLKHKKGIVEKAYKNFSGVDPSLVPSVDDTLGSPLQYGYRTKLTPHFDLPKRRENRQVDGPHGTATRWKEVPPIGFMRKGMRQTLDIEDCPIGTGAVRLGLQRERKRVADELHKYKRGATLLLRESTRKTSKGADVVKIKPSESDSSQASKSSGDTIREDYADHVLEKSCITDPKATTTEYISSFVFQNTANAFFQNNNSILPDFVSYIRSHVLPHGELADKVKYLVDAYCGSGLFTVTLSSLFEASMGVDIDQQSIDAAHRNLTLNNLHNAIFQAADAPAIFESVAFPPDQTVVIIDPPRRGCDESFLLQLLRYGPRRVVYVSCNVHTQARDVGFLVRGLSPSHETKPESTSKANGTAEKDSGSCKYDVESIKGFDFFPQTGHVEGVAILNRTTS